MNFVFIGSSPRAWGSEQHFISLAVACRKAGHRVIAVVRAGSEVAALMEQAGIDVRATPFRGGSDPRALAAAFGAIREIRADWLVTAHKKHYWSLLILARLTGTRLAVFRHLVYVRDWWTRVVFPRLVDRFFVVSDFALDTLVEAGAPRQHLYRLYNQIDLQTFRPDADARARIRSELNVPDDAFLVGFVGRHEATKGVHLLREALAIAMQEQPNVHAIWVGNGPDWSLTQAEIAKSAFATRHRFIEWTRTPELIYPSIDCLVAPSLALETFGRVVAEAQACGIPVIAAGEGGMKETFVPGQTGEVGSRAPYELARQIVRLSRDQKRRSLMGQAGREFVQRFEARRIVREFVQSLDAVAPPIDSDGALQFESNPIARADYGVDPLESAVSAPVNDIQRAKVSGS